MKRAREDDISSDDSCSTSKFSNDEPEESENEILARIRRIESAPPIPIPILEESSSSSEESEDDDGPLEIQIHGLPQLPDYLISDESSLSSEESEESEDDDSSGDDVFDGLLWHGHRVVLDDWDVQDHVDWDDEDALVAIDVRINDGLTRLEHSDYGERIQLARTLRNTLDVRKVYNFLREFGFIQY